MEPIPQTIIKDIDASIKNLTIINGYGPTEATICATLYHYQSLNNDVINIPIGQPVNNAETLILDPSTLNPVNDGDVGELFISGDCLARGYMNREEQNSEKFIHIDGLDEVFYRTGDLVKRLTTGDLFFVGRKDRQLKLRGYRIKLEEIEKQLLQHPGIEDCYILVRDDITNTKQMVAYLSFRFSILE